jgi:hypothetical protein
LEEGFYVFEGEFVIQHNERSINATAGSFIHIQSGVGGLALGTGSVDDGGNGVGSQNGGNGGVAINGGVADGASGSTSGNGNAGNGGIAIGAGSVANGDGDGHSGGVALNGDIN